MVLRFYSYLFALVSGLFMTGVATVLLLSDAANTRFEMLPFWKGQTAIYGLLVIGLCGLAAALLGYLQKVKPLLVAFTLVLFGMLVYGYFISPVYRFAGAAEMRTTLYLVGAALLAFVGSLAQFSKGSRA